MKPAPNCWHLCSLKPLKKFYTNVICCGRRYSWHGALVSAGALVYILLWVMALGNTCSRSIEEMPEFMFRRSQEEDRCTLVEGDLNLVKVDMQTAKTMSEIESGVSQVSDGGTWKPSDCNPWQRIAIIIPYKHRYDQLKVLMTRLHPMLQTQKVHYTIYVAEQITEGDFNKGKLMNIAALEAMKDGPVDCLIFHDVDMIPEHDGNIYYCNDQVRHLSPALDEMRYHLMYCELLGGAVAIKPDNFYKVNGYPMIYLKWGAEDDDFAARTEAAGLLISRPPNHIGRYKMVKHSKQSKTEIRYDAFLQWRRRWQIDGVKNLQPSHYDIVSAVKEKLFTHLKIDVKQAPAVLPVVKGAPQESVWWFLKHFFP